MDAERKATRNKLIWWAVALTAPVLEVAVLILVARLIGVWTTLLLVLLSTAVGLLFWTQWFRRMMRDHEKLKEEYGEALVGVPAETLFISSTEFLSSFFAFFCFLAPGFLTDSIGFLLSIPAIRDSYRQRVETEYRKLAAAEGLALDEYLAKKHQAGPVA
ncbi:MAG: FxsA family protein [Bdellovibrionales bacterium]|nr:FxsA family protein [Bdellovibrionales bacterium]